jgi:hypothetical protein
MATRSEKAHEEAVREAAEKKRKVAARKAAAKKAAKKAPAKPKKTHKQSKAVYAAEPPHEGRPSRRSTRKTVNRSKPDTGFTARESMQKGSPEARARRAKAKGVRARGSS